jgi:SAM-dependent methyltransferase
MQHGVSFDRIADRYEVTRGGAERGDMQADALLPWLPASGPVVEVGVGTGAVAAGLRSRGLEVVGVDLSVPMLERAAQRLSGRLAAGDALALPLRSGSVAAVYFVYVLHLVPDVAAALTEAGRVLAADGRIAVICGTAGARHAPLLARLSDVRERLGRGRIDDPDDVVAAAGSVGLRLLHRGEVSRPVTWSPAELARSIESREWSWTWDVDDAVWAEHVAPIVHELQSLPDAEQPVPATDNKSLLVFADGR